MRIERWNVHRDGAFSEGALRQKVEARGPVVTPCRYPPSCLVALPADTRERRLGLAAGMLKATIGEESAILAAGDILTIPAGSVCRVEVLGPSDVNGFHAEGL